MNYLKAIIVGVVLTLLQLCVIIFINSNSAYIWEIALSFLIINGFTIALIMNYMQMRKVLTVSFEDHEIDPTLQIANETLPFLRRGLNEETAHHTAEIIRKISDVAAVAITDRERVLAYVGHGCGRHIQPGSKILTRATKEVIKTGELKILDNKQQLNCAVKDCVCPLEAAVIAPLKCRGNVVGTVKMYKTTQGQIPSHVISLASGIAQLLAVQMELAELDRQSQLVTKAELHALQAQINPHFLFNTLNTIIMFSRTNPETARRLLIRLATFFRQTLKRHGHFNSLREEMEYINTYLVLEKARFREKLRIIRNIDQELLDYKVPVLTLQPLVENAVKHGITAKQEPGAIQISIQKVNGEMLVTLKDDGVGISPEKLQKVYHVGYGTGNGVGLSNVHERLKSLFGEEYGLKIESELNVGTTVYVRIPLMKANEGGEKVNEAKSLNS